MNKYKLVVFDLDGTLADTSPGIYNSIRYVQKKMGLPEITPAQMRSHIGPPMEESYHRNFNLAGDELKTAISYHKEYAMQNGYKELFLYDGIKELLIHLRNQNIKVAIATLKAHTTAVKIFENLGISDLFDCIIGADAANPMTKSQMIDHCISEFHLEKKDCVLIGDSSYDAIGAQESGIDFIAVTYGYGFGSAEDAAQYKHTQCCHSVEALSDFLIG